MSGQHTKLNSLTRDLSRELFPRPALKKRLAKLFHTVVNHNGFRITVLFILLILLSATLMWLLEGSRYESRFASYFESLWFTVVTITTVGYGDMAPVGHLAQLFAMATMLWGIVLVGLISGNMASFLVEHNRKKAMGLASPGKLDGHTIICGWKSDMREILLSILQTNPDLHSSDLVLVTNQPHNYIGDLKREPSLRHLHFIFGDHTSQEVLSLARVKSADKVIILSETHTGSSPNDLDARSVLSATSVQQLNPVVYTCTELVQPHFSRYLKKARVEEVMTGEADTRNLITVASLGLGLANVVGRFYPESGQALRLVSIPQRFVGGDYRHFSDYLASNGLLALGLLENTGNLYDRKIEALHRAIRTASYPEAVARLKGVAALESNRPRLAPPPGLPIPPHAKGIVLLPKPGLEPLGPGQQRDQTFALAEPQGERLLICGYKRNMADLLINILRIHQRMGMALGELAVASKMADNEVAAIQAHPDLKEVRLIKGETTSPKVLRAAGVEQADKVLILSPEHRLLRPSDADSHSVMTAMAVLDLNRRAYKTVELASPDFYDQLMLAETEEVVFTRRHHQVLLAQAAAANGLSAVLKLLVDVKRGPLRVVDFPPGSEGLTFAGYSQLFQDQGMLLAGVIENAGPTQRQRRNWLKNAQRQTAMQGAINHLLDLKKIVSNQACLNPGPDYRPGLNTRAVVLTHETAPAPKPPLNDATLF